MSEDTRDRGTQDAVSASNSALQPGQRHIVKIEKLTFGGAGLAHIDGKAVFIPGSIPGQEVAIVIVRVKSGHADARLEKIRKRAMDEIRPRCAHFHDCGGCTWQNLSYDKQINYKEEIVRETLTHLTPVSADLRQTLSGRVLRIIPSPHVFHYRNKLELSFGFETMRSQDQNGKRIYFDENPTVGFHQPGQWATVLPISECHLYDENLPALLSDVRRFMNETKLQVYNPKTHKGFLRSLLLRRGVRTGEHMIGFVVNAKKRQLEPLFQHFMRFAGRSGQKSLILVENTGMNDKPDRPVVHCLAGKPSITERLFDLTFEISPFSFFQTNTLGAEKLYQSIIDMADITLKDTVLDAYCGMGTIGQYLARFCQKVVGIESSSFAIDDALKSSACNKIGNISFYKGKVEQVLSSQIRPGGKYVFHIIVVDPPRMGLHPKVRESIIAHCPRQIIYVSCNIATFARDLGDFLKNGYELRSVQPVDMFPHTAHIETVAVLQKAI